MSRLFGTSGVRKRVEDLTDEFASDLGKALGSCIESKVAVGRDCRQSGPRLEKAFIGGLTSAGRNVVKVGLVPTPTVGVATAELGCGVVVTASHNPPEYNGFKFFDKRGAYGPEAEDEVEELFRSKRFKTGRGSVKEADYVGAHIRLILARVGEADGLKVLLDCAGGAGSVITPMLLGRMGCEVEAVNVNRDGTFPHPLEPTADNLKDTCRLVEKAGVDIGFAHDGDADRTCAIGRDGRLIEWDTFLTVLASGSKKVVTTVDASMRIEEFCDKVYRVAVGDVAVAEGIRKHKAGFGGEPSGTYIFPDVHIFPDGVAAVAKATKLVADGTFYKLVKEIPSYPMERVKIPCQPQEKETIMDGLRKLLKGRTYSDVDGIRITEDDGWILLRPSGTEDYVRITAEGKTKAALDILVRQGKEWVKAARQG
ncbi:MAG: phosphoglucosamine mutase [Candidatus Altiarchaeota archaeon]